jgi:hypothetical protein
LERKLAHADATIRSLKTTIAANKELRSDYGRLQEHFQHHDTASRAQNEKSSEPSLKSESDDLEDDFDEAETPITYTSSAMTKRPSPLFPFLDPAWTALIEPMKPDSNYNAIELAHGEPWNSWWQAETRNVRGIPATTDFLIR